MFAPMPLWRVPGMRNGVEALGERGPEERPGFFDSVFEKFVRETMDAGMELTKRRQGPQMRPRRANYLAKTLS